MTDKPNYSLKDLLNELKKKEKEFENCEIVIQDNNKSKDIFEEVLNIKLESKEYLELDVEQQCSLIMSKKAEISALKKGIKACEEYENKIETAFNNKEFWMKILRKHVTIDEEERMKFICWEDCYKELKSQLGGQNDN